MQQCYVHSSLLFVVAIGIVQQCYVRRLTSVMCLQGKVRLGKSLGELLVRQRVPNVAPAVSVHSSLLLFVAIGIVHSSLLLVVAIGYRA